MAAYQDGFSARDANIEIGHLLGLRWFRVEIAPTRGCHELTYHHDQVEISSISDPHQILLPAGPTVTCSCGATFTGYGWGGSALRTFIQQHDPQGGQRNTPVLSGVRAAWEPGENAAQCLAHGYNYLSRTMIEPHRAPERSCHCGYWAYWELGEKQVIDPAIVAIIKGYGAVIEGDLGFRCSHAKIEALHLPYWDEVTALALEDHYEAPVYSKLQAMLAMHKAPEGQPPLRDAYFSKGRPADDMMFGGTAGTWNAASPASLGKHLRSQAVPCNWCGRRACAKDQRLCAACQAGISPPTSPPLPPLPPPATASGTDAVTQLHERREKWAKDAADLAAASKRVTDAADLITAMLQRLKDAWR